MTVGTKGYTVYRSQRALLLAETVAALEKAGADAVAALRGALEDESVGARVRAARNIIEMMYRGVDQEYKMRELNEIQAEIDALRVIVETDREDNGRGW